LSEEAMQRAFERIDADFDSHVEVIRGYLKQPSVSSTGEGIKQGAEATAALIDAAGGKVEIVPTEGHPALVGLIEGDGPKLVRYGMYDVQPAEEADWTSPPFAAEIRNVSGAGPCIVARGAANSKGCLAAFLLAIQSLRKAVDVPVTIAFIVDGEEELGSTHLAGVFDSHRELLAADAAFDLDLTAGRSRIPEVYLGCKGILSVRLVCGGGDWGGPVDRALHSSEGVVIASPAWSLARAACALVDSNEQPLIPSLQPAPVPPEDEPFVRALAEAFDDKAHLEEVGARSFKSDLDAYEIVRSLLYGVAVNLNGIRAGYPEGGKTIIPHEADAVLDLRLPYGLDPDTVMTSTREIVARAAPEVEVQFPEHCPAARTSPSSPVARAMIASHSDIGRPATVWPSAAWWAPYFLFQTKLDLPFAIGGAGHAARAHASDEYASIDGLREHMRQSIAFLYRFASEKKDNSRVD
jgi:acetylornithine deacetylase/succinyl-diaminopimelate desuccinylase-like protein